MRTINDIFSEANMRPDDDCGVVEAANGNRDVIMAIADNLFRYYVSEGFYVKKETRAGMMRDGLDNLLWSSCVDNEDVEVDLGVDVVYCNELSVDDYGAVLDELCRRFGVMP